MHSTFFALSCELDWKSAFVCQEENPPSSLEEKNPFAVSELLPENRVVLNKHVKLPSTESDHWLI